MGCAQATTNMRAGAQQADLPPGVLHRVKLQQAAFPQSSSEFEEPIERIAANVVEATTE